MAVLVRGASNVRFGPELYCGKPKNDVDVVSALKIKVFQMADDLRKAQGSQWGCAKVVEGDARDLRCVKEEQPTFDAVICSPPYPTEHDYTRNCRLELALLEMVVNLETLRTIKRNMIRSHTKNIYKGDNDVQWIHGVEAVEKLTRQVEAEVVDKTSGFHRYYPKVVNEYFGGMQRHFNSVYPLVKPGGVCAYVVGDQASYCRIEVPTARILETLAMRSGFKSLGIKHWRSRWSTATSSHVAENILLLQKAHNSA